MIITRSFDGDCRVVTRMGEDGNCSTVISGSMEAQPYSMPILRVADGYYIGIVSVADFDKIRLTFKGYTQDLCGVTTQKTGSIFLRHRS